MSPRLCAFLVTLAAATAAACVPHELRAERAQGIATGLRSADPAARDRALGDARAELRFRCRCMGGSSLGPGAKEVVATDVVPALVARLSDPDPEVRERAADTLAQMRHGPAGAPAIEEGVILRAMEHPECAELLDLYPGVPSAAAVAVLERIARSDHHGSRDAASVLARSAEGRARLFALLHDEAAQRRAAGLDALRAERWSLDDAARASDLMLDARTDPSLRRGVAEALRTQTLPRESVDRVVATYDASKDGEERSFLLESLRGSVVGRLDLLDRLLAALGDGWTEEEATALLRGLDRRDAVLARLEPMFDGPLRGPVARAMTAVGPSERMVDRLARCCSDEGQPLHVRVACLRALGALGPAARTAWPVVERRAERTGDREEFAAARDALRAIDPKRAARTR